MRVHRPVFATLTLLLAGCGRAPEAPRTWHRVEAAPFHVWSIHEGRIESRNTAVVMSLFAGGGAPSSGSIIGIVIGALLLGIPMAYLQVGVPAGIYRALGQGSQGDVFA